MRIANFLRVCAELISANLDQIRHFLIPHSFILALYTFLKVTAEFEIIFDQSMMLIPIYRISLLIVTKLEFLQHI